MNAQIGPTLTAVAKARQIVAMAHGPFIPADLAAAVSMSDRLVGSMIEAVASQDCVPLKDGTGRVALVEVAA